MRTLICVILAATPVAFGVMWGVPRSVDVPAGSMTPEIGLAYIAPVPATMLGLFRAPADDLASPQRSTLRLLEDGRALGPAHSTHDDIRREGSGRFSHWRGQLYFSTTDNSAPMADGRRYSAVFVATLWPGAVWIWFLCLAAPVALRRLGWRRTSAVPPMSGWSGLLGIAAGEAVLMALTVGAGPGHAAWLLPPWLVGLAAAYALAWRAADRVTEAVVPLAYRGAWSGGAEVAAPPGPYAAGWRWMLLLAPPVAFALMLLIPQPRWLLAGGYERVLPVVVPAVALLALTYARRGVAADAAGLSLTLLLFVTPIAALWHHVGSHVNAVGGLLPFSDASYYYIDASRLADGHLFTYSARRPLFAATLAGVLALTNINLQLAQVFFAAVNGVAAFLFGREIRPRLGSVAAALSVVLLFLFYRVNGGAGTMLTENIGLPLGALGMAVIWRAGSQRGLALLMFGVGLLTLGLMARAGAFFVLPGIVVAAALSMGRRGGRLSLVRAGRVAAVAGVGIVVAATMTAGLGRALSVPVGGQSTFSNFSYSLYGLAAGGKGWQQVQRDHPEALEGAEIYSLAFQRMRDDPGLLAIGSLRMWAAYLPPSAYHAFAFAGRAPLFPGILFVLAAVGWVVCLRAWRDPASLMLAAAFVGHVLSVPFVPPIDAGLRAYAATQPVLILLVAVGVHACQRYALTSRETGGEAARALEPQAAGSGPAAMAGVLLVVFAFVSPLVVRATSRPVVARAAVCGDGQPPLVARYTQGAFLRVVPAGEGTRVPRIEAPVMQQQIGQIELRGDAERYAAGATVMLVHDVHTGRFRWLVAAEALLPDPPALLRICGHAPADSESRRYSVFVADTVDPISGGADETRTRDLWRDRPAF